ncbi:MAG: hypothetical protein K8E24_013135 [Methanobacterium paludis]|nr:hypothetical protein [Methanobacterium paludis]
MVELGDFGVRSNSAQDDDNYEVYYNSDLEPGDMIEGEVFLSEIKDHENAETGEKSKLLTLVITSHEEEEKWVVTYWNPKLFTDDVPTGMLYGKKGGKLYLLIDSILSSMFKDVEKGEAGYHSVDFEKFREGINSKILSVHAEAIKPTHFNAKAPNIVVTSVTLSS